MFQTIEKLKPGFINLYLSVTLAEGFCMRFTAKNMCTVCHETFKSNLDRFYKLLETVTRL